MDITVIVNNLKKALKNTKMPENVTVSKAFELIEQHIDSFCTACKGTGKVRVWIAQDELGPSESCKKCKGTGRRT